MQKAIEQQLQTLGKDVMQVLAGAARSGNVSQGTGSATTLTTLNNDELAYIRNSRIGFVFK